ncbi:MAG TPA: DUF1810 domain-containing protein [Solirubrobacterales bacterium]|jgi:uncharacterized protein (DUF1810 family)|nr:DUF1810 domain-containing protein [Solirubrobacterales bacterium]
MDTYDLQRFVDAQEEGDAYEQALSELRAGRKTSHWMWFVFPQRAGLGQSAMSRRYAIGSAAEAQAYLDHPVLGPRLVECSEALLAHDDRSAREIFGGVDEVKLRSSMTLFAAVASERPIFQQVLDRYFEGEVDASTTDWL